MLCLPIAKQCCAVNTKTAARPHGEAARSALFADNTDYSEGKIDPASSSPGESDENDRSHDDSVPAYDKDSVSTVACSRGDGIH